MLRVLLLRAHYCCFRLYRQSLAALAREHPLGLGLHVDLLAAILDVLLGAVVDGLNLIDLFSQLLYVSLI